MDTYKHYLQNKCITDDNYLSCVSRLTSKYLFFYILYNISDVFQNFHIYMNELHDTDLPPNQIFDKILLHGPNKINNTNYFIPKYDKHNRTLDIYYPWDATEGYEDFQGANKPRPGKVSIPLADDILNMAPTRMRYEDDAPTILELHERALKYIHPVKSSLDIILKEIPEFAELKKEIKKRIIQGEPLNKYAKSIKASAIDTDISDIKQQLFKNRTRELRSQIENVHHQHRNQMEDLSRLRNDFFKYQEQLLGAEKRIEELSLEPLKKVLKDPRINDLKIKNNLIILHTNPLTINWDERKAKSVPKLGKLKDNQRLGIGRHQITIDLQTLDLRFTALDNFLNYHIEKHTCYGNFTEPIIEAQKEFDIPRIVMLALQMLQHITIGDEPGIKTVNDAYIIDDKDIVHISARKKTHLNSFLNNHEKERIKNAHGEEDLDERETETQDTGDEIDED